MALIPTEAGILTEILFFHDEVKAMPKEPAKPEISQQEISMGKTIISGMKEPFEPAKYQDEYRDRLWEIIQTKANHQEITQPPAEQQVSVINMMDALQQMLEQSKAKDRPGTGQRSRRRVSKP